MIQLTEHRPSRARLAHAEIPASTFIPYACHYGDETILTKNGQMLQVLRLDGFAADCADLADIDLEKRLRNVLFKSIAGPDYALWFHMIRKRQAAYPQGTFEPGFARDLNRRWKAKNEVQPLFQNELYISIVKRGQASQASGWRHIFSRLSHQMDELRDREALAAQHRELSDIIRRFGSALAQYRPHLLTTSDTPQGPMSEPLAFLGRLINLEDRPVLVPAMDISRYLASKRLFFGENALECRGASARRFAAIISIKEYAPESAAGMMDSFLALPFEYVMTQSFRFSHRQAALARMQLQQRRMEQTKDLAASQIEEIDQALDDATAGSIAFGEHHLTLQPIVGDLAQLGESLARIETELMNLGIIGVREDLNMEPCFWAQLPGNFEYIARRATISTANLSSFASLHNYPTGRREGNHWGPAVTVLETQSGTPYFFNFHVRDVGHTTVIGPTGSGKTALLNFLCAQARKFGGRLFYFDRDRGAEIFLRALGGSYSILGADRPSGFNPLQLPDTPVNRGFLNDWLASLLVAFGGTLTGNDLDEIAEAVEGNYRLSLEHRRLEHLAPFFGWKCSDNFGQRLTPWHGQGPKANLFDNPRDLLSFDGSVFGFEMGQILKDEASVAPVLSYLFHRIRWVLDGTPTIIVLEEAWALLKNPLFMEELEVWLKTFRKLNALVIFSTQSVEDAMASRISPTLIQQTATHIYFPNPKATEHYRSVFRLSERELHLIREDLDPGSRYFLLKHGADSVVARADLSDWPDALSVLSARAETLPLCERARLAAGERPEAWLPYFEKEVQHASH
jgi:type IV secretion system protein VirB4